MKAGDEPILEGGNSRNPEPGESSTAVVDKIRRLVRSQPYGVLCTHGDQHAYGFTPADAYHNPVMTKYEDVWARPDFKQDPKSGVVQKQPTEDRINYQPNGICPADLDVEIKHWENVAQELDQNREIKLVELNSLISKRANALELLSNMQKKKHESQQSVIGNLR